MLALAGGYWAWRASASSPTAVEPDTAIDGPPLHDNWLPGGILIDPSSIAEEDAPAPSIRRPAKDVPRTTAPMRESTPPPALLDGSVPLPSLLTRITSPSPPQQTMPGAEGAVVVVPPAPVVAAPAAPPVPVDSRVYSEADLDVEPPVLLSPRPSLPPRLSPTDKRPDLLVELLVNGDGTVQSARLLDRPTQFSDMNVLPPLKLLKFRPATRDGRAVIYRHRMRLSPAGR
jgi:hypothetical protein